MKEMKDRIRQVLKKGTSSKAEEKEQKEMFALFHQSEIEYELKGILLEEINAFDTTETTSPNYKELFKQLLEKINQRETSTKPKIKINAIIKIAAAVIVGLFLGIFINSFNNQPESIQYAAHSPRGSISEIMLPDGTIIFLNSDSRIEYKYNKEKSIREVSLSGEAWFDVEKDKKRPFIVHTPLYDVNVTGTQFNVKAYDSDNEITTTLEEGQVIIHSTENIRLAENIVLVPGEQVVFNRNSKELEIKKVNTHWFTSWKNNKLIFVNMELKDLVVLLERKYGVDIEIKNKDILDLHFDGTIKNESILELLEIIKETLPINYKIVGQKIEITNNKN